MSQPVAERQHQVLRVSVLGLPHGYMSVADERRGGREGLPARPVGGRSRAVVDRDRAGVRPRSGPRGAVARSRRPGRSSRPAARRRPGSSGTAPARTACRRVISGVVLAPKNRLKTTSLVLIVAAAKPDSARTPGPTVYGPCLTPQAPSVAASVAAERERLDRVGVLDAAVGEVVGQARPREDRPRAGVHDRPERERRAGPVEHDRLVGRDRRAAEPVRAERGRAGCHGSRRRGGSSSRGRPSVPSRSRGSSSARGCRPRARRPAPPTA